MTVRKSRAWTKAKPSFLYRFWSAGKLYERSGYPSKLAAQQAEWDKRGEVGGREPWHEAPPGAGPDARLQEYAERWLKRLEADVAHGDLAPRTVASYRNLLDVHILPALGRLPIKAVTRQVVLEFLDGKRAKLSKSSVRLLQATLSTMFTDAMEAGDVTAHPVIATGKRRRGQRTTEAQRTAHIRPMTREQRDALLATGTKLPAPYPLLFELLAKTGLRPGEAFGLQVGDVDLERGVIRVWQQWDGTAYRPTKTHQARTVDLTPGLVAKLRAALSILSGPILLPNATGHPLDIMAVRRAFWRILKAAKLPQFRLYDLRHTYASMRLLDGAPITYVSAQLGHRDAAITLRFYAKWAEVQDRRWVEDDRPVVGFPNVRPSRTRRPTT